MSARHEPPLRPAAITLDFGNTLVPVHRDALRRVVERTATAVVARSGPFSRDAFLDAWHAERERQFAEEVPEGREVDVDQRVVRVLARMRGMPPPPPTERWDDSAAATRSSPEERASAVDAYSAAFVAVIRPPAEVGAILAGLADRFPLAILSNWPLAATIDRFVEEAGWGGYFRAIVVSQRVGAIKPSPVIFAVAEAALGTPGERILHVGDDWQADVVGAKRAGWLAAYLRDRQGESSLPSSSPDDSVRPDLVIDDLADLPLALAR
ncbi:MAG TPA: HAD family hydrolase [Candidatus Limnocylindrales bacterium]